MAKKRKSKSELAKRYERARRNYLKSVRYYETQAILQGYKIDFTKYQKEEVKKPKRITEGSIRRLEKLTKKLKGEVHEQKVETGYYSRMRKLRAKAKSQPQSKSKKSTPKKLANLTEKPSYVQKPATPPKMSDVTLRVFEKTANAFKSFSARSKPYEKAVRDAAYEASDEFKEKLDSLITKYMNMLKKSEVRNRVSENLSNNYSEFMDNLQSFLFEFWYEDGEFKHTDIAVRGFNHLIEAGFGFTLTQDELNELNELANKGTDGTVFKG